MARRFSCIVLACLVPVLAVGLVAANRVKSSAVELRSHSDACIHEGFNVTMSRSFPSGVQNRRMERTLLVVTDDEPLLIDLCHRGLWGELAVRLTGSDGKEAFSANGRSIRVRDTLHLAQGEYTLVMDWRHAAFGGTSLCLKGGTVWVREPDLPFTEVAARPEAGFSWPYLLHVPEDTPVSFLLVAPNNTGRPHDWFRPHLEAAKGTLEETSKWAEELGAAVLVPVFPRPKSSWQVYTHALDRDCLSTDEPGLVRLDLQLAAMIADARQRLADRGTPVHHKVLMYGFSASGMFVNRFSLLHPELVAGVASGSPGGWPLAPVAEHDGSKLPYPVGVADLEQLTGTPFDPEAVRRVRMYLFLGGDDTNDSVPYRDGYEEADQERIDALFGTTPVRRWPAAEQLYREAGCTATFELVPGVGHEVDPQMKDAVLRFFKDVVKRTG